ncbi:MAG: hypothetical protein WDN29_02785 [Methylovirgula sp.]
MSDTLTIKPFDAARIKIERSKHHLRELQSEIDAYFQRDGAAVVFEIAQEMNTGFGATGAFTYREKEPIPHGWSAIIGDVLHNLRSSLDLAACDIHRITGGRPKDISAVHYPFCKDKSDLARTIKERRLGHIGPEFTEAIRMTAPYKGGNEGLRAIHDLNILDKHQALVPTVNVVSMDWPVPIREGSQKFVTGNLKDGFRIMLFPRAYCKAPLGSKIKADISIIFGNVGTFKFVPIVKQLERCIGSVEGILGLFQSIADKKSISGVATTQ